MTAGAEAISAGFLWRNLLAFARLLRRAGVTLGPGAVLRGVEAVQVVDLGQRAEVRAALRAAWIVRAEDLSLFDAAFHEFFAAPRAILSQDLSEAEAPKQPRDPLPRRLAEALSSQQNPLRPAPPPQDLDRDATGTWSEAILLRTQDFSEMSQVELAQARAAIARMRPLFETISSRRRVAATRGHQLDLRRTLAASLRLGGDLGPLRLRKPAQRLRPLVVLCDVSGSMSRYSELFLRFVHGLTAARRAWDRVESFVFGTALFRITRALSDREVESALAQVGRILPDWGGGTRLGDALLRFNRDWTRRIPMSQATVLLLTDGLDGDPDGQVRLAQEAAHLRRSCAQLIWLNPLLGWSGFVPRARGIVALLPHVHLHLPVHNLHSLADLATVLSESNLRRQST